MYENKPTILFLSTYPPRECGIATFTQDLLSATQKFMGPEVLCRVAAFNLSPLDIYKYPDEVRWEIDQNNKKEQLRLAKNVNTDKSITGVILQHEYGIFGGIDGEDILIFMKACKKPILVTLHTVLPNPSDKMKEVTEKIIKIASTVIVLTHASEKILEEIYPNSIGKTFVIPHGIHQSKLSPTKKYKIKLELEKRIVLATFGLLSRGKGVEHVIKALPSVIKKYPSIIYLVLGETHPVVRRNEGELYRLKLEQLVTKLGLEKHVKFYNQYLSLPDLFEFLKATDIYIASSTNPNQAVSGTLSYALGTGLAVISTSFAQAKELVTEDTGRLVPVKNSAAISFALLDLLSNEKRLAKMRLKAYAKTRAMLWSNVSKKYISLLARSVIPRLNLGHLQNMTDDFGLFQFASLSRPNKDFGYTLDDNARALIVCSWMMNTKKTLALEALIKIYLTFIKKCQQKNGTFINYVGFADKSATVQNNKEDLEDTQSRALWALSEVMSSTKLSRKIRDVAREIFLTSFLKTLEFTHLRSSAYTIKSFSLALEVLPEYKDELLRQIIIYADNLLIALKNNSVKSWIWFEKDLNYNNALLSESLIMAGHVTKNPEYTKKGVQSLQFLISKTFSSNMYMPIGHSNWYKNKKKRSKYDQQPEDPASMILALVSAYKNTHNEEYRDLAKKCFSWFLGNNSLEKPLYDYETGAVYDGLHPDRVNLNQGAESLVSYLMSSVSITELSK